MLAAKSGTVFRRCHSGLTLVELMLAMAVLAMVMGTLASLGTGVEQSYEYTEGHGTATQHARVALDRMARAVTRATANEQFPGFIVLAERENTSWRFPDTLVVWCPSGEPADPTGLPRFQELLIYCPSSALPNRLAELSVPGDARTVPAVTDTAAWAAEIAAIKQNVNTKSVALTDLMRTASARTTGNGGWRGCVRFEQRLSPSNAELSQYRSGTLSWSDLAWPQGLYGSQTGMRQAWLRCELQLMPGTTWVSNDPNGQRAVPFFGSAAVSYELQR